MKAELTPHGFKYGPATVELGFSDEKKGWVVVLLRTEKYPQGVQVCVTKSGQVRIDGKKFDQLMSEQRG